MLCTHSPPARFSTERRARNGGFIRPAYRFGHNGSSFMATMATDRPQDGTCSIEPKLT